MLFTELVDQFINIRWRILLLSDPAQGLVTSLIQFFQKVPGSASLNDLHPIGLIEITRKVWSIVVPLRSIGTLFPAVPLAAPPQTIGTIFSWNVLMQLSFR